MRALNGLERMQHVGKKGLMQQCPLDKDNHLGAIDILCNLMSRLCSVVIVDRSKNRKKTPPYVIFETAFV